MSIEAQPTSNTEVPQVTAWDELIEDDQNTWAMEAQQEEATQEASVEAFPAEEITIEEAPHEMVELPDEEFASQSASENNEVIVNRTPDIVRVNKFTKEDEQLLADPNYVTYSNTDSVREAIKHDEVIPALVYKVQKTLDHQTDSGEIPRLILAIMDEKNNFSEKDKETVKAIQQTPEYRKAQLISEIRATEGSIKKDKENLERVEAALGETMAKNNNVISRFLNRNEIATAKWRVDGFKKRVEGFESDLRRKNAELAELNKSMLGKDSEIDKLLVEWTENHEDTVEEVKVDKRKELLENNEEIKSIKNDALEDIMALQEWDISEVERMERQNERLEKMNEDLAEAVEYLSKSDDEKIEAKRKLVKQAYDIAGWGGTVQYDNYGNEALRNIGGGLYDEGADVMAYIAAGDDIMTFEDYKKKKAMVQELALKKKKLDRIL